MRVCRHSRGFFSPDFLVYRTSDLVRGKLTFQERSPAAVERTRVAEERGAVADELTAGRESRAQVRQLERALALAQEQLQGSADAVKDLETRIAKSGEEKRALQAMLGRNAGLETGVGWSHAG